MNIITSIKDPLVQEARSLQSAKYRKEHSKTLLYGLEQLEWACKSNIIIEHVFVEMGNSKIISHLNCNDKASEVSPGVLKKISDTTYIVSCMAIVFLKKKSKIKNDFIVVMDNLQDVGNIGSIIRTAKGFSVDQFVLSEMEADPFGRKAIDASRGYVFETDIAQIEHAQKTIDYLKSNDYQIVVTSPYAKHLQSQTPLSSKKIALVVGNETKGINDLFMDNADIAIQIPMNFKVESLNVSVSAGISIYELQFKQVLMMLKENIFADFGRQVNVTGKLIRMAFDKEIRKCSDFSGMQVILMMIMHCDETMSEDQISKDIALFAGDMSEFMKPLIDRKLVNVIQNEYSLSDAGINFLAEIWPIAQRTHQKIMIDMTEEESKQLKVLLLKVQKGCTDILKDKD